MTVTTKQATARCLFCDAQGVTKEHILARSLTELFPGHGTIRHDYNHPETGARRVKRASTMAYVARKFCAECNNGWMNELDQAVRPLLEAFACDRAVELTPADQETLALWATKTLFGFMAVESDEYRFASSDLYRELYRRRAPLAGSQVWLGANENGDIAWARSHSLRFENFPGRERGLGASLSFGYAVVHLMYHGSDDMLVRLRYDPHRALKQVWPTQPSVAWPPALRMRPRDLTPLAGLITENSAVVFRRQPAA